MRTLGEAAHPAGDTVDPGTFGASGPADGRSRASFVEGSTSGWWSGGSRTRAAERRRRGRAAHRRDRWLLPDGTTETDGDDYVVVMNRSRGPRSLRDLYRARDGDLERRPTSRSIPTAGPSA
jgi:hypothetical protein